MKKQKDCYYYFKVKNISYQIEGVKRIQKVYFRSTKTWNDLN